ncbi:hypothetical protein L9F63_016703 [Diploptera punctata]|uniref:DUF4817 domain-containing protein n=1 Tax=Diploptera punctata TaxID=6984 RepID=A0AAD8EHJ4_DIPPU|nr:hypothetical protein L9F63_016703 [Diploptera punctata]
MTDMLLVYGKAGSGRSAVWLYQEQFRNRRVPHHTTFAKIERGLRERDSLDRRAEVQGRPRSVRIPENEEDVLRCIENNLTATRHRSTIAPKS